ncbi:BATF3 factor, partial [Amia calva]|nr:BATF3 factor [Amia calva]
MKTCRDELEVKEEDFRVECYSKTLVVEQLEKYRVILKKVLDGQPHISGEARERALQDLLWEYETLEQEYSSLKKEVQKLTEERKRLTEALKAHEPLCPLVHCAMNLMPVPRPDVITSCLPR